MLLFESRWQPRCPPLVNDKSGYTLIGLMVIVSVIGIMLSVTGQSWKTIMQREREEELIFRGLHAISRWYKPMAGQQAATPLMNLKDLVLDPRPSHTSYPAKYLRRYYLDPMTGKEWRVIRDPNIGITGVASTSEEVPFKIDNFPDEIKSFAGKKRYCDWEFDVRKQ